MYLKRGLNMPAINVEVGSLSVDQKRALAQGLTDAAASVTGVPKQAFYVFIREYPNENVAEGGELLASRQAR